MMVWAFTNKPFWTWGGGKSIPFLKYWGFNGIILMILAVILSSYVSRRLRKHQTIS
jgi:hypothetical protein